MLLNNFFYVDSLSIIEEKIEAQISINTDHPILKGHFPTQPVVPGVCMIEMLKEVLQLATENKYQLESASVIKFLIMFAPQQFTKANFDIIAVINEVGKWNVQATLQYEQNVFLKFKGIFIQL
jgi:3-hydroxyacyl-[acyl-carrier-protein] dehydratase